MMVITRFFTCNANGISTRSTEGNEAGNSQDRWKKGDIQFFFSFLHIFTSHSSLNFVSFSLSLFLSLSMLSWVELTDCVVLSRKKQEEIEPSFVAKYL